MPLILANILRPVVVALIQTGAIVAVSTVLEKILDFIRDTLKSEANLSEEETNALVSNETLDMLVILGVTYASLRSKIPIRIADRLGLTATRGAKQTVAQQTKEKVAKSGAKIQSALTLRRVFLISLVGSIATLIPWLPGQIQQWMDQGVFNPRQFNRIMESFGISFRWPEASPLESPGPFSSGEFEDYARGLESAGIKGINNPGKRQEVLYSRLALAELVDYVYGVENAKGVTTTATKIKKALAPYLIGAGTAAPAAVSLPASGVAAASYTPVKIFTGVLSSGTLGAAQPFSAREDDLINSAQELRDIAQTNAAVFLSSLPGRIQYEIRVVNNVLAADGSKRVGATQQVQVGTLKSGAPRLKTVTNKFAVMDLYYSRREGTRTKIASLTLGPTDVGRFNPTSGELAVVGTALAGSVSTSQISDISAIVAAQPLAVQSFVPLPPPPDAAGSVSVAPPPSDSGWRYYFLNVNGNDMVIVVPWSGEVPHDHRPTTKEAAIAQLRSLQANPRFKGSATIDSQLSDILSGKYDGASGYTLEGGTFKKYDATARARATTLSEFYAAMSLPLPSVSERGNAYQSLGLGAAALYTGTVEQNTKLLLKLQGRT